MAKIKDMKNKKYNRLLGLECVGVDRGGNAMWLFQCDCGNETKQRGSAVRNNSIKSCGCYKREKATKHGKSSTPIYKLWNEMRMRCNNKNNHAYGRYGGRGIKVCKRWDKFENFLEDMGDSYSRHLKKYGRKNTQIDRADNSGNYEFNNCKWVTAKEQQNNKRTNIVINYDGRSKTLSQWAKYLNIKYQTLWGRIYEYGWNKERALSTPSKLRGKENG